jgi:hypothetical protein
MPKYKVLRRHIGDRAYEVGEERDGEGLEHLVPKVLEPIKAAAKAEAAPKNKAEAAAPANKATSKGKGKAK